VIVLDKASAALPVLTQLGNFAITRDP